MEEYPHTHSSYKLCKWRRLPFFLFFISHFFCEFRLILVVFHTMENILFLVHLTNLLLFGTPILGNYFQNYKKRIMWVASSLLFFLYLKTLKHDLSFTFETRSIVVLFHPMILFLFMEVGVKTLQSGILQIGKSSNNFKLILIL